jgi:hypothetical protein
VEEDSDEDASYEDAVDGEEDEDEEEGGTEEDDDSSNNEDDKMDEESVKDKAELCSKDSSMSSMDHS